MIQNIDDNILQPGDTTPDFVLPATDGKTYGLSSFTDARLLVISFICNHCPYVQAYEDRMVALQADYGGKDVQFVAICSNDEEMYPEDGFDQMIIQAMEKEFNFPYLRDKSQEVAQKFGAQCTPEFFVFDENRKLQYHGRIDDNWKEPGKVTSHDMRDALTQLLAGQKVSKPVNPAIGCSIKWLK